MRREERAIDDRSRVARLFSRAGFGASRAEIDRWTAQGYQATVDHLLGFPPAAQRPDNAEVVALETSVTKEDSRRIRSWWMGRMATTAYPLEEKLTLYWHRHFATSLGKVDSPALMVRQNRVLRENAAGDFRALCNALHQDAAMLIWLDGRRNRSGSPNENYGREFMELFTLGKDQYTQGDVAEVARAFTGFRTDDQNNVSLDPKRHDQGTKVILGNGPANYGATDVTDLVLDHHPQGGVAATYVATRLASFFHHPEPEPDVVAAMARSFAGEVGKPYSISAMLRTLFGRPEFTDGPLTTIKSPAELVAGSLRALGIDPASDDWAEESEDMGQKLFYPPDVSGWKGGAAWANSSGALARYNCAARLSEAAGDTQVQGVLSATGGDARGSTHQWMDQLGLLQLQPETSAAIGSYLDSSLAARDHADRSTRGVLTLLLASPDYNLR